MGAWPIPALIMALTVKQPNVMQVIEFRKTPDPFMVMEYYKHGNIMEACLTYDQYVTAIGQILDGLGHLHAKGDVYRDLKPENLLVEKHPFFKIVISDFGLSRIATDTTLLRTFCGTLKYLAPEVFPGSDDGYGSLTDVWALGVIGFEWLYDIPDPPTVPRPRRNEKKVQPHQWRKWIDKWACSLRHKLEDQDNDLMMEILLHMIEIHPKVRWRADQCLRRGFENNLFKRRVADGLVVNPLDQTEAVSRVVKRDEEARTPAGGITTANSQPSIYYRDQISDTELDRAEIEVDGKKIESC